MKKSQDGFIIPLLIIICSILIIGAGAYVHYQKTQPVKPLDTTQNSIPTDTKVVVNQVTENPKQSQSPAKKIDTSSTSSTGNSKQTQSTSIKYDIDNIPLSSPANILNSRAFVYNGTNIKVVQTVLEGYFQDNNKYPQTLDVLVSPSYIHDQKPLLDYLTNKQFSYQNNGTDYEVCGSLETGDLICAHKPPQYNSGIQGQRIAYPKAGIIVTSRDILYSMEFSPNSTQSPNFKIDLRPGTYEIHLDNPGSPSQSQVVKVLDNQYININF